MTLVNLGAGDLPFPAPWVNVDAYAGAKPDVCADARHLPFASATVTRLYCGHLLEHVPWQDVRAVAAEVGRVLDGVALFVGPDLDRMDGEDPVLVDAAMYGAGRWTGDLHLWPSTASAVVRALAGELDVRDVPIAEVEDSWPIPFRVGWQYAILAS